MLQTKALYNFLRLNPEENSEVKVNPWALEDFRQLPLEELFSRLKKYHVQLDRNSFCHFAEQCDTPEELAELLLPDEASQEMQDPFYLLLFELWRRFLPEKQSLSVFCDEIDHRIVLYEEEKAESDEQIQDALANLLEVLDENADAGAQPEEIFAAISDYCAHDIETFIYDYIADLLDQGSSLYASELIEGFSPYMREPFWFDFLRARLLATTDMSDANLALYRLLENELEVPLLLEMLYFLATAGNPELFTLTLKKTLPLLTAQEDLGDVMALVADYYRYLDEEENEQAVRKLITERKGLSGPLLPTDPLLKKLRSL